MDKLLNILDYINELKDLLLSTESEIIKMKYNLIIKDALVYLKQLKEKNPQINEIDGYFDDYVTYSEILDISNNELNYLLNYDIVYFFLIYLERLCVICIKRKLVFIYNISLITDSMLHTYENYFSKPLFFKGIEKSINDLCLWLGDPPKYKKFHIKQSIECRIYLTSLFVYY